MDNKKIEQIYELLCDQLIAQLSNPETATPGVMQAALRLLADNQVEAFPVPGGQLHQINEKLRETLPFPPKTKAL